MFKRVKLLLGWCWRHKRRSALYGLGLLVGLYVPVFILASCTYSPTDQKLLLPNQKTLAYQIIQPASQATVPRVLLIHGTPTDASSWKKLTSDLSVWPEAEIIAVDRLGFGHSTTEDELTLAGHAASLEPLLGAEANILVGHSYGGPVALRAAVDYPDKVQGLILVAGACDAYMQDSQGFRRAVDGISLIVPEPWARANRELLALTDENRAMESLLDQVTCPVIIVHGTWDPVCPYESTAAYLQERLVNAPSVEVIAVERAGHNLHLNHPEQIILAVEQLLAD